MSNIWFIGDIHAGHLNQTRWRTGFQSEDEIFNIVKQNYNDLLRKKDTCYFLGDIALNQMRLWDIASYQYLQWLSLASQSGWLYIYGCLD